MFDLSRCESPLERAFGEALFEFLPTNAEVMPERSEEGIIATLPGWSAVIVVQPALGWCRPDFAIVSMALELRENALMIEIDGHEFHERTKEQARRDRARDRRMSALGWKPIRFTGQEVHEDAYNCAEEALRMFIADQRKVLDDGFTEHLNKAALAKRVAK